MPMGLQGSWVARVQAVGLQGLAELILFHGCPSLVPAEGAARTWQ